MSNTTMGQVHSTDATVFVSYINKLVTSLFIDRPFFVLISLKIQGNCKFSQKSLLLCSNLKHFQLQLSTPIDNCTQLL